MGLAGRLALGLYFFLLGVLFLYALHRLWIVMLYRRARSRRSAPPPCFDEAAAPAVTVQVPIYNEKYVVERVIDAVCRLDYPRSALSIQILDDSSDETVDLAAERVAFWRSKGVRIEHLRRSERLGFKAGALQWGLGRTDDGFIAIFDADFVPPEDFLRRTMPFFADANTGMVQTRWGHLNRGYSLLTRLQAILLDGHFLLEHTARFGSGAFFNFNGTAGVWRRAAIEQAGGWSARTITEDLDLSYRAQLCGWRFVYLPDVVCPAELPIDIFSFRSQQNRWAKGALQVARHLLADVWAAPVRLTTKIEATAHLTANIGYLMTLGLALLLMPMLLLRALIPLPLLFVEAVVFVVSLGSILLFYAVSQRELYPDWHTRLKDLPALLGLGVGMGLANAPAVWRGLWGRSVEFVRTPKYGKDALNSLKAGGLSYSAAQKRFVFFSVLFSAYASGTAGVAVALGNWPVLPFLSLFVFGFSYMALEAVRFFRRRAPRFTTSPLMGGPPCQTA